jgi:hypothetical protein
VRELPPGDLRLGVRPVLGMLLVQRRAGAAPLLGDGAHRLAHRGPVDVGRRVLDRLAPVELAPEGDHHPLLDVVVVTPENPRHDRPDEPPVAAGPAPRAPPIPAAAAPPPPAPSLEKYHVSPPAALADSWSAKSCTSARVALLTSGMCQIGFRVPSTGPPARMGAPQFAGASSGTAANDRVELIPASSRMEAAGTSAPRAPDTSVVLDSSSRTCRPGGK